MRVQLNNGLVEYFDSKESMCRWLESVATEEYTYFEINGDMGYVYRWERGVA